MPRKKLLSIPAPTWALPDLAHPALVPLSIREKKFVLAYLLVPSATQAVIDAGYATKTTALTSPPKFAPGTIIRYGDPGYEAARLQAYRLLRQARVRDAIRALQAQMSAAYGCSIVDIRHGLLAIAVKNQTTEPMAAVQAYRVLAQLQGFIETRGSRSNIEVAGGQIVILADSPDLPRLGSRPQLKALKDE